MADADLVLDSLTDSDFETFVRRFSPRLLATACRIVGKIEDAEDAVQESLMSAWRARMDFDGRSSLYTWLHRIVVNRCLQVLRSRAPDALNAAALGDDWGTQQGLWSPSTLTPEQKLAMVASVERALISLPPELKAVLLLRDVEELSSKEVAVQLNISDAAVRQRLHRARTIMAELLRPELCAGRELTCGGRLDLLFDHLDHCLNHELSCQVDEHLMGCKTCTGLREGYRVAILTTGDLALTVLEPSPRFIEGVLRRLEATGSQ